MQSSRISRRLSSAILHFLSPLPISFVAGGKAVQKLSYTHVKKQMFACVCVCTLHLNIYITFTLTKVQWVCVLLFVKKLLLTHMGFLIIWLFGHSAFAEPWKQISFFVLRQLQPDLYNKSKACQCRWNPLCTLQSEPNIFHSGLWCRSPRHNSSGRRQGTPKWHLLQPEPHIYGGLPRPCGFCRVAWPCCLIVNYLVCDIHCIGEKGPVPRVWKGSYPLLYWRQIVFIQ